MPRLARCVLSVFLTLVASASYASLNPTIYATMSDVRTRLETTLTADSLVSITAPDVVAHLTEEERRVLSGEYVTFTVDKPINVTLFRDLRQPSPPYWLQERGFTRTDRKATVSGRPFEAWEREFDAGNVGLGINGFAAGGHQYFPVVSPQRHGEAVRVTNLYPNNYRLGTFAPNTVIFNDPFGISVDSIPEDMNGDVLVMGPSARFRQTQVVGVYRITQYPASTHPDQIVLTWSDSPATTQSIQWRTSPNVADGVVRFRKAGTSDAYTEVTALRTELTDRFLINDPVNARFTVTLTDLTPDTRYEYFVGSPTADTWSESAEFTTAPDGPVSFTFMYLGDVQHGFDTWGGIARKAYRDHPEARFWILAGDLVGSGKHRNEWDAFFANSADIFRERPLMPVLGNHEYSGGNGPWMYVRLFALPENGPHEVPTEHGYALQYGDALFLVLDHGSVEEQIPWINDQLANSDAKWKIVVAHESAYPSSPRRTNSDLRDMWTPIFDRYHVDLSLNGHDHAYLRTYPMRAGERVESPAEGTVYIISVAGTKMYPQGDWPYTEFGFTDTMTYQVIDINVDDDRLEYRAYDESGHVVDEFTIEK